MNFVKTFTKKIKLNEEIVKDERLSSLFCGMILLRREIILKPDKNYLEEYVENNFPRFKDCIKGNDPNWRDNLDSTISNQILDSFLRVDARVEFEEFKKLKVLDMVEIFCFCMDENLLWEKTDIKSLCIHDFDLGWDRDMVNNHLTTEKEIEFFGTLYSMYRNYFDHLIFRLDKKISNPDTVAK